MIGHTQVRAHLGQRPYHISQLGHTTRENALRRRNSAQPQLARASSSQNSSNTKSQQSVPNARARLSMGVTPCLVSVIPYTRVLNHVPHRVSRPAAMFYVRRRA